MATQPSPASPSIPPIPWWVAAIVIVGALLVAAGGIFAAVRPETLLEPGQHMNQAAHVYAGYLISRNLALAVILLATLGLRARRLLVGAMVLVAFVQSIDGVVDATSARTSLLPIVVVFAVAFLVGATRLSEQPLWRVAAQRSRDDSKTSMRPRAFQNPSLRRRQPLHVMNTSRSTDLRILLANGLYRVGS